MAGRQATKQSFLATKGCSFSSTLSFPLSWRTCHDVINKIFKKRKSANSSTVIKTDLFLHCILSAKMYRKKSELSFLLRLVFICVMYEKWRARKPDSCLNQLASLFTVHLQSCCVRKKWRGNWILFWHIQTRWGGARDRGQNAFTMSTYLFAHE